MKLLLLLLLPLTALAQSAAIRGTVREAETGQPVPFASVALKGTPHGTTATEKGTFELTAIPAGTYTLSASAVGFTPQTRGIVVKPGADVKADLNLKEAGSELAEVVVSGTLQPVIKSQSAVPVEIYTPKFFQKNPSTCLFENLTLVNGVRPQLNCNVCGTGDIHINGLEGPYTMILIDGMPIVSSLSTVYGLHGIPNSMIDRVEIVKGPASTLYGSEAVGGLINVITKDAARAPRLTVDAFGTSHGEANLDLGTRLQVGKATALLSANGFRFTARRDVNHDGFTDIPTQQRGSVFTKWQWARPEQRLASVAARYYYEDRFGGQLAWQPEYRGGDSLYGESVYTNRAELLGQWQLPIAGQKVLLSGSWNDHRQHSAYGTTLYNAVQRVAFGQLTWARALNLRHELLLGASLRHTYYDDNTPATAGADGRTNRPDSRALPGIFVQDEWHISPDATLLSGIRLDHDTRHGAILAPRLNYKWATHDQRRIIRAGVGNGYRVVNLFTEDHAALTGARRIVVPQALRPERSWNVSLNYQHFFELGAATLGLDGGAFYTYFTNKITPDYATNPDEIIYRNLDGYAISRGVALNADLTAGALKVLAGATLLDAFRREQPLEGGPQVRIPQLHAPSVAGTWTISYNVRQLGLSFDYTGQLNGPMHLPVVPNDFRPARSPWFSLQNIQATQRVSKSLELYAGVKNLLNFLPADPLLRPQDPFDKQVNAPGNPNGYTFDTSYNYAPVQGRRAFAGLRWSL